MAGGGEGPSLSSEDAVFPTDSEPPLEESFTIHLGQHTHMHKRILSDQR